MPTRNDIVKRIRDQLSLTEPDLDTSVGTTTRKMIDAFAESLAEVSIDNYLIQYQYDIDSKSGSDLDDFVRLFGFTRLPARRSTGMLLFERPEAADDAVVVPFGSQVTTNQVPPVVVQTLVPAVLIPGDTEILVPAEAVEAGARGNVSADTLTIGITALPGISGMTNPAAFTGGVDAESDEQLRSRFRRTVFRNMAGTEPMFLGVALENPAVTQANVIGAKKRHREQLEVVSGEATSTIQDASYIFPFTSALAINLDLGGLLKEGVHYTFDHEENPPEIESLDAALVPDGVYDVEFDYTPMASRNDPIQGITNRIDVWIRGEDVKEATESLIWQNSRVFSASDASQFYREKFQRRDESHPTTGNFFIPLGFAPVIDPSRDDHIIINDQTYVEGEDYWLVNDMTAYGLAPRSMSGLEWKAASAPTNNSIFALTYTFDAAPRDVELALQNWRLVTSDVWVHRAKSMFLKPHFIVVLDLGADIDRVKDEMEAILRRLFREVGFNSVLQASDILAAAHGTDGVDSIRWITSSDDGTNYAIERFDELGNLKETFHSGGRVIDVFTSEDSLPELFDIRLQVRANNTFGTM